MTTRSKTRVRKTVERANRQSQEEERERTAGSAQDAAERRVTQLQQRSGWRRFVFENGLSLAAFALFAFSFVGQVIAGHRTHNEEQRSVPNGVKIESDQWFTFQQDLLHLNAGRSDPEPVYLETLDIYAAGHDFEAAVVSVSVEGT